MRIGRSLIPQKNIQLCIKLKDFNSYTKYTLKIERWLTYRNTHTLSEWLVTLATTDNIDLRSSGRQPLPYSGYTFINYWLCDSHFNIQEFFNFDALTSTSFHSFHFSFLHPTLMSAFPPKHKCTSVCPRHVPQSASISFRCPRHECTIIQSNFTISYSFPFSSFPLSLPSFSLSLPFPSFSLSLPFPSFSLYRLILFTFKSLFFSHYPRIYLYQSFADHCIHWPQK